MSITLNVGGKKFETTHETLARIPVFKHMFEACTDESPTLFLDRSPHVFKHVLAFAQDPQYSYPIEYEYELKFYCVEYDKGTLHDKYGALSSKIDKLQSDNAGLVIEVNNLTNQIMYLMDMVRELKNSDAPKCSYGTCSDEPTHDEYCEFHYKIVYNHCAVNGCTGYRRLHSSMCEYHHEHRGMA